MFVSQAKSYCVSGGGDHSGRSMKDNTKENIFTRSTCRRLCRSPAVTSLKKTQSLCGPLQSALGSEILFHRGKASRSVEDLFQYTSGFGKCRSLYSDTSSRRMEHPHAHAHPRAEGPGPGAGPRVSVRECGLRACMLLMLGAWRARRAEARALRGRLDQMKLQVAALRALNTAEAERATLAHQDAAGARSSGDALRKQLLAARVELEAAHEVRADLEARLNDQSTTVENLRNQLQRTEQEAAALDLQLTKERAKLSQAREERGQLTEEMEVLEHDLDEKVHRVKECERLLDDAQEEHNRALTAAQEEIAQLAARCRALEEAVQSEQLSNSMARQALAENVQELLRVRAQLEAALAPRAAIGRLLALLLLPLQLMNALYISVCPFPSSSQGRVP